MGGLVWGVLCLLMREEECCFEFGLFEDWVKTRKGVSSVDEVLKKYLCFLLDVKLWLHRLCMSRILSWMRECIMPVGRNSRM